MLTRLFHFFADGVSAAIACFRIAACGFNVRELSLLVDFLALPSLLLFSLYSFASPSFPSVSSCLMPHALASPFTFVKYTFVLSVGERGHLLPRNSKSLFKPLATHSQEHYAHAVHGVFPADHDSAVALALVSDKFSPANFW
jgi:hypothetical protein